MTKIDIVSGFLGAGKTTLIKKLIEEAFQGEKLVLIENEFGEIGIDGGFLKDAGINITEMNSGCICCSLVGDFGTALVEVLEKYSPDRIVIEPSGVGKLSDVIQAVRGVQEGLPPDAVKLNSFVTVADATKCKMYMKNFGEFYNNQIEHAGTIVLSRTGKMTEEKLQACLDLIRQQNAEAAVITTPWEEIDGEQMLRTMEKETDWQKELVEQTEVCPECGHVHHEHEHVHHEHEHGKECCHGHHEHEHGHGEECCHGHHEHEHGHGEGCGCGHHEHEHGHGEECCHGHHEHEHGHGEGCGCGHHEHEHGHGEECCHGHHEHEHGNGEGCGCGQHHDHHHADDVFTSIGMETAHKYTEPELTEILKQIADEKVALGTILRAKGIVASEEGQWFHFDLVPGEYEVRRGNADYTGRICVIGAELDEAGLKKLFTGR
ncbi:MAG: cobalamin biosynthesis protein CobW [Eubacterium sp.]|jgi:G3E family GTPase|nr:cobalamin biosynthesis protein CobW [Eubacterium sp.]